MKSVILIVTRDEAFGETLGNTLGQWGLSVLRHQDGHPAVEEINEKEVDLILLDIRHQGEERLNFLHDIKSSLPDVEVLLINKTDNINVSIKAMQAGADDEIIAPCDSGVLKKKIAEASRRRLRKLRKKDKRSILELFSDVMAAATFAQAGEFETAVDIYKGKSSRKPGEDTSVKGGTRLGSSYLGGIMDDIRVLLVDDEEEFVRALSERLNLRNLISNTAFSGEQAMRSVGDGEPHIMVLDLKMPGINGMEVLRKVRKKYPDMQVIIQTGHGSDQDEAEARNLGVFDYLKKPVDIDVLVERIKAAAKLRKSTSSARMSAFSAAPEGKRGKYLGEGIVLQGEVDSGNSM